MCGIFCVLKNFCNNCDHLINQLAFESNIRNRGPDNFKFRVVSTNVGSLAFASSVLWLQGSSVVEQPIEDADSIFCYNGDIFSGLDGNMQKEVGDTHLFQSFIKEHIFQNCLNSLVKIHGPYSFLFFDKKSKVLYFGRDIFGRRSLLLGQDKDGETLILTSVAKRNSQFDFIELPSVGIFQFDISKKKLGVRFWQYKNRNFYSKLKELEEFLKCEISVEKHISEISHVTHNLNENDNLTLLKTISNKKADCDITDIFSFLLNSDTWLNNVQCLKQLLEKAVCQRISTQPEYCKKCIQTRVLCRHATTGLLFSGGVDCGILAALTDKYVDKSRPIDLINVSFDESKSYQSPDRLTGLQTLEELKVCCPNRIWNFVEVNVTKESLNQERGRHIADLIYPLNTILDDSLGCALWFASKGESTDYVSSVRILIVGMGADELFGGYSKHRAAFKRYSWKGLQETLEDDWMNLPYRNLGRDDRVVSDHGRQLRTPYLDENVVEFVRSLECWEKTYPSDTLPQGVGEKILLRTMAYHLGLKKAALLKKRALQFGSRIADSKENAHDVSPRLGV